MLKCNLVSIPQFRPAVPRLQVIQRLDYSRRVWHMFRNTDADLVFSTQSSPFIVPRRMFHFLYSTADLFSYPHAAAPLTIPQDSNPLGKIYVDGLRRAKKLLWGKQPSRDWFFAVGSNILRDLKRRGYSNSSLTFPPCRVSFRPRFPKKKQVVQASRIIPDKRLESYFDIASRLTDYEFLLIGKRDQLSESAFPGYAERILSRIPRNVVYVDALVRDRPELLEQSKVYLYTGSEPGIGLAMVEAMAAGCIPFSSIEVGAADVLRASGVGELYRSTDEAVAKLRMLMEREINDEEFNTISNNAGKFGPQVFKQWIKKISRLEGYSKVSDYWPN
jgi:glycosyltransferase involved in cell wall biosynthesis